MSHWISHSSMAKSPGSSDMCATCVSQMGNVAISTSSRYFGSYLRNSHFTTHISVQDSKQ